MLGQVGSGMDWRGKVWCGVVSLWFSWGSARLDTVGLDGAGQGWLRHGKVLSS